MHNANNTSDGDSAEALAAALMEIAPLIVREARTLMRAHRGAYLSVPQFRALGFVRRHPACSLTAVAEHLGLSVAATSRLVDGLVDDEFILREPAPDDRRFITLRLTDEGERIQADARAATLRNLAARLEGLSAAQRAEIVRTLEPLREIFTASTSDRHA